SAARDPPRFRLRPGRRGAARQAGSAASRPTCRAITPIRATQRWYAYITARTSGKFRAAAFAPTPMRGSCIRTADIVVSPGGGEPPKTRTKRGAMPSTFIFFDILYDRGLSVMNRPLLERKALLEKLVRNADRPAF